MAIGKHESTLQKRGANLRFFSLDSLRLLAYLALALQSLQIDGG